MIPNKASMYHMLQLGLFGNALRSWNTWHDLEQDGYTGLVGLRSKQPGGKFYYALQQDNAKTINGDFVISETPDDTKLLIQGECTTTPQGVYLIYSDLQTSMREALMKKPQTKTGLQAVVVLKQNLCDNSYQDLQALFDLYPTSVIEFSTYSYNLGKCPRRNTVIWEVRDY